MSTNPYGQGWVTITGPNAFCEGCRWTLHADQHIVSPDRQIASAARHHAKDTGHRVRIERGQSRMIEVRP